MFSLSVKIDNNKSFFVIAFDLIQSYHPTTKNNVVISNI